ncbi:hypothetical protein [Sandarakinorhabdus sp.]|uniref:hypothetical protein n=1 Tax=Sandarakinorhabdus sp. TaxID=1916663 RepID=UPI00286DB291|nr:hypothetical protein [Sandarakinorhabdus sp.]
MLAALLLLVETALLPIPPGWSALCPRAAPGEIIVCADAEQRKSPFRSPIEMPRSFGERGTASVSAERNSLLGMDVGSIGGCSAYGPGGWTGCSYKGFKQNVSQAAGGRDTRGRVYERAPK